MTISIEDFSIATKTNYATLRNSLKSGDILLCSGTKVFSRLIQQATQSVWSHVAFIIYLEALDRFMVLESVETIGVRTVPLSSYLCNYNGTGQIYPGHMLIARHQQFDASKINQLSKHAIDLLGYPYNTEEIVDIATRISGQALGLPPRAPDDLIQQNSFICSEYAYICFKSIGITIPYNPAGFIAPADFARDPNIEEVAVIS